MRSKRQRNSSNDFVQEDSDPGFLKIKKRDFIFTINNYKEQDVAHLQSRTDCRYLIFSKEIAPTTSTPHLQGFACFDNPRSGSGFQKWACPRKPQQVAVYHRKGTCQQASEYCRGNYTTSDGKFKPLNEWVHEFGELPETRQESGKRGELYWKNINHLIATYQDDQLPESYLAVHHKHYEKMVAKRSKDLILDEVLHRMLWLYGTTRTGKTGFADQLAERSGYRVFVKEASIWWNGYTDEEVVIFPEFSPTYSWMSDLIKLWTDRTPFSASFKHGDARIIRPKWLIITSNYTIQECFSRLPQNDLQAVQARFDMHQIFDDTPLISLPRLDQPVINPDYLRRQDNFINRANTMEYSQSAKKALELKQAKHYMAELFKKQAKEREDSRNEAFIEYVKQVKAGQLKPSRPVSPLPPVPPSNPTPSKLKRTLPQPPPKTKDESSDELSSDDEDFYVEIESDLSDEDDESYEEDEHSVT